MNRSSGGNFALYPTTTAHLFGARRRGTNYGTIFLFYGIMSCAALFILPTIASGEYPPILNWVLTGIQAIGTALVILLAMLLARVSSTGGPPRSPY